ncbi:MAG: hypothetical protein GY754_22820 [bacterium]|nr:hypothetical protein [bacterium]
MTKKLPALILLFIPLLYSPPDILHGEEIAPGIPAKKRIAVMDFTVKNIAASFAKIIRNKIELSLYKLNRFDIIESNMIRLKIEQEGLGSMDCNDPACAARIGKAIVADYVIMGAIDASEELTISIRAADVQLGKIVYTTTHTYDSKEDLLENIDMAGKESGEEINKLVPGIAPKIYYKYDYELFMFITGGYLAPQGTFKMIVEEGYCFTFSIGMENVLFNNLYFAVESGYYRFPGKGYVQQTTIIPIMLQLGYSFKFFNSFFISPMISGGTSYNMLTQTGTQKNAFEPMIKAGAHMGYKFNTLLSAGIETAYCAIMEQKSTEEFLIVSAGVGINF